MRPRLLIIDDDTALTSLLTELLDQEGFEVETHSSGSGAAGRATSSAYALVILDVMLPDVNGFEVLKQIRGTSSIPVILLTARGDDVDRIVGLEIGADDYVPKPFNPRELVARVRAVLRRAKPGPSVGVLATRIVVGPIEIDVPARVVRREGQDVPLTSFEFRVLLELAKRAGET